MIDSLIRAPLDVPSKYDGTKIFSVPPPSPSKQVHKSTQSCTCKTHLTASTMDSFSWGESYNTVNFLLNGQIIKLKGLNLKQVFSLRSTTFLTFRSPHQFPTRFVVNPLRIFMYLSLPSNHPCSRALDQYFPETSCCRRE